MMEYLRTHRTALWKVLVPTGIFVCGGLASFLFITYLSPQCRNNYKFINSDIACGKLPIIDKTGYVDLRDNLLSYIDTQKAKGNVTDVAIYFRDLVSGPVFGINELESFAPASLLKLPLAFVFFDIEENGGEVLSQQVKYSDIQSPNVQTFPPPASIEENRPYSIDALIFNTLAYSDNLSYEVLLRYMNGQPGGTAQILQTFQDLGIIDPKSDDQNTISVRSYASLFRLLYNVSYLNNFDSEEILSWLSQSSFDIGLVAGVPKGTVVAHKFGEREYVDGTSSIDQLHDCGIVYYPGNPYLLCVMTRGTNIKKLPEVISKISNMVYTEVDSRKL